jgi:hypothetical protein
MLCVCRRANSALRQNMSRAILLSNISIMMNTAVIGFSLDEETCSLALQTYPMPTPFRLDILHDIYIYIYIYIYQPSFTFHLTSTAL